VDRQNLLKPVGAEEEEHMIVCGLVLPQESSWVKMIRFLLGNCQLAGTY